METRKKIFIFSFLFFFLITTVQSNSINHNESELQQIYDWHQYKDSFGPSFSGSLSWIKFMEVVEEELRMNQVTGIRKDFFKYSRWHTSDTKSDNKWSLTIDGQIIPVSSYWAYSGRTTEKGVTGELLLFDKNLSQEELRGKIIVFELEGLPENIKKFSAISNYEYASEDVSAGEFLDNTSDYWYQVNYLTRFGKVDEFLKNSGALGAVVILDLSPGRAEGLYTFPLLRSGTIGVPGLYTDRTHSEKVRFLARNKKEATIRLLAEEEITESYFLYGFLPGKKYKTEDDRFVLLTTHTDGPNLTQDNGAFGIIKIIEKIREIPINQRERSILILLDPEHFTPGRHSIDWFKKHSELSSKISSVVAVEHLGQMEFIEKNNEYGLSGKEDRTYIYSQNNQRLIDEVITSVKNNNLRRTYVLCPDRGGQGPWAGMGNISQKLNVPGYGISTSMSGYWSTQPGIESFNASLFLKQVSVMSELTLFLMNQNSVKL